MGAQINTVCFFEFKKVFHCKKVGKKYFIEIIVRPEETTCSHLSVWQILSTISNKCVISILNPIIHSILRFSQKTLTFGRPNLFVFIEIASSRKEYSVIEAFQRFQVVFHGYKQAGSC